jgi:dTDP-4-dehydrorhamnose reductase
MTAEGTTGPAGGRRLLIIGASGQVGRAIAVEAATTAAFTSVVAAGRSVAAPQHHVDLSDLPSIERLFAAAEPTHVMLTAATTNVAWCESQPAESRRVNVEGVAAVAAEAARSGAHLTFFSTDYVFDGSAGPYAETDRTHPINVYGSQKLEAEALVLERADALVVRTCQVFGPDPRRANYVLRTVDSARAGREIHAPTDMLGTPTFAPDLGRIVVELAIAGDTGLWHVAGAEHVSRFELARMAVDVFGGDPAVVGETTSASLSDGVPRPLESGLRCARLASRGLATTPLRHALERLASTEVAD